MNKEIIHCPKCLQIDRTSKFIPEGWVLCNCPNVTPKEREEKCCCDCGCELGVPLRSEGYCTRLGDCDCHLPPQKEEVKQSEGWEERLNTILWQNLDIEKNERPMKAILQGELIEFVAKTLSLQKQKVLEVIEKKKLDEQFEIEGYFFAGNTYEWSIGYNEALSALSEEIERI